MLKRGYVWVYQLHVPTFAGTLLYVKSNSFFLRSMTYNVTPKMTHSAAVSNHRDHEKGLKNCQMLRLATGDVSSLLTRMRSARSYIGKEKSMICKRMYARQLILTYKEEAIHERADGEENPSGRPNPENLPSTVSRLL